MPVAINAQGLQGLLDSVKVNSPQIKALENYSKAIEIEAKTGIYPENPKVGFGYFPASVKANGVKQTFSVSQEFDFPTVYTTKAKLNKLNAAQQQKALVLEKLNVLVNVEKQYVELNYTLEQIKLVEQRVNAVEEIQSAFKKRFENGDVSRIELNKANMELSTLKSQFYILKAQKTAIEEQLSYHFGNEYIAEKQIQYPTFKSYELKDLLDAKIANHPGVQLAAGNIDLAGMEVKQSKAEWMPSFEVGFELEKTDAESFRGVGAGISIPLWHNAKKVKLAKAKLASSQSDYNNSLVAFKAQTKATFYQTEAMEKSLNEINASIKDAEIETLLKKAYDLGELTVIEFFTELDMYFTMLDEALNLKKELYMLKAELYDYTLL